MINPNLANSCSTELFAFIKACDDSLRSLKFSLEEEVGDANGNGGMGFVSNLANHVSGSEVDSLYEQACAINTLLKQVDFFNNCSVKLLNTDFSGRGIIEAENAEWGLKNVFVPAAKNASSFQTSFEINSTMNKVRVVKNQAIFMYNHINPEQPFREEFVCDCAIL